MLEPAAEEALLAQIAALDEAAEYARIIDALEAQPELNLKLACELARAYLNQHTRSQDDFSLRRAEDVLNTFEDAGGCDAQYLYLKAMTLIKENLLQDALLRLERAARYVPLTAPDLFARIEKQRVLIAKAAAARPLNAEEKAAFDAHAAEHFGAVHAVLKGSNIDIVIFAPSEKHPYYLAVTRGLSALRQSVPAGADPTENSCLEIALPLPQAWPLDRSEIKYYYPFKLMFDLAEQVRLSFSFVGFGFTLDNGAPFVPDAKVSALMLIALGDYPKRAQSYALPDGFKVNIFQMLPLYPAEAAFRREHSAAELLERMRSQGCVLCPYYEDRKDAVSTVIKTVQA